jgi:hypothetical protein
VVDLDNLGEGNHTLDLLVVVHRVLGPNLGEEDMAPNHNLGEDSFRVVVQEGSFLAVLGVVVDSLMTAVAVEFLILAVPYHLMSVMVVEDCYLLSSPLALLLYLLLQVSI